MIPYGKQDIDSSDIEAVTRVLNSDRLTQGSAVPAFEKAVADYCGSKFGIAVNSGTSALHVACLALGLGSGDWLWTSPNTFVASANCGRYCGANVDFVDIDPRTYNISIEALTAKLEKAANSGKLPKVVIPVQFAGQSCSMSEIKTLADKYGFKIIEDACHALGGNYKDYPVGSCCYSDIAVFSFHPVKSITTGEGGMAVTNSEELATRMRLASTHGITRENELMTQEPEGSWCYQQIELGYNYRMTDIQATLGISQLQRLDSFIQRRHDITNYYNSTLSTIPATLPYQHPDSYSAAHLYVIRLQLNKIGKNRSQIFEELRRNKIGVNVHYIPVHTQPYYWGLGFRKGDFLESERYYSEALSLPIYPTLQDIQIDQICQVLSILLLKHSQ